MSASDTTFGSLAWPLSRLNDAVDVLAVETGHGTFASTAPAELSPLAADDPQTLGRALERMLTAHGLEVEPGVLRYRELDALAAPMIVRVPTGSVATAEPSFLLIGRRHRQSLTVLATDRQWRQISHRTVGDALRQAVDVEPRQEIEQLLEAAGVAERRRPRALRAMLDTRLADTEVGDVWRVVQEPGGDFRQQLRSAGIGRQLIALVALHAAQFALWIGAWALIGRGALEGRTEWGWLIAWVLLLATIVPMQIWTAWIQGVVALSAGRLLKGRLLVGALRLDPEAIRHQGAGELLGRVLDSDAVESLAVTGGLQAGLALVELAMAGAVLWLGAAGGAHVFALGVAAVVAISAAFAYYRSRERWSALRVTMTQALVERIAGHRTRLAQQAPARWHEDEDRALEEYLRRSTALDRWAGPLSIALPRGWTAIALAALSPAFLSGAAPTVLAISLGGIVLGAAALRRFADGLSQLSGAAIAWQQARPLFEAAAERPMPPAIGETPVGSRPVTDTVLDVRDITYQYPSRPGRVLNSCTLAATRGQRLLLEGPSGGGKSTLASMIAGLREPSSGLVLVGGLDRRTLGAHAWRRRVVCAPQFHENYVFGETFAFNLLMGRRWPPSQDDVKLAEEIVDELGLGGLVARMPAGLLQLVGESGWQLSHGERSRLYMARALLQGGDFMILDESFAALDPENLRQTLECVLRRAPTLMVIAHP